MLHKISWVFMYVHLIRSLNYTINSFVALKSLIAYAFVHKVITIKLHCTYVCKASHTTFWFLYMYVYCVAKR